MKRENLIRKMEKERGCLWYEYARDIFPGMTWEIPKLSRISVQKTVKLARVFCSLTLAQDLMAKMEAED